MTLQEIQFKLYEMLKPSGWGDKLKTFILGGEFQRILSTLYSESQAGRKFTPVLANVFRAFEQCPYSELKVVMIGQDPYSRALVADGIAFSCSKNTEPQPSLRAILEEVDRTVNPWPTEWDLDLKRWSNQGVLMLNSALTCEIGKSGSHTELWKPFIQYLLDTLTTTNPGLIYAFLGTNAKELHKLIPSKQNYKFFCSHPASVVYNKEFDKTAIWDSGDLFNSINNVLMKTNGNKITW